MVVARVPSLRLSRPPHGAEPLEPARVTTRTAALIRRLDLDPGVLRVLSVTFLWVALTCTALLIPISLTLLPGYEAWKFTTRDIAPALGLAAGFTLAAALLARLLYVPESSRCPPRHVPGPAPRHPPHGDGQPGRRTRRGRPVPGGRRTPRPHPRPVRHPRVGRPPQRRRGKHLHHRPPARRRPLSPRPRGAPLPCAPPAPPDLPRHPGSPRDDPDPFLRRTTFTAAAALSALVFTAGHELGGPVNLIFAAFLAAVTTALLLWRRSLVPCIVAHTVHNTAITALWLF